MLMLKLILNTGCIGRFMMSSAVQTNKSWLLYLKCKGFDLTIKKMTTYANVRLNFDIPYGGQIKQARTSSTILLGHPVFSDNS